MATAFGDWGPGNVAERRYQQLGGQHRPTMTIESPFAAIEPTRPPPRPKRRKKARRSHEVSGSVRLLSALFTLALIALCGGAAGLVWFDRTSAGPGPLMETRSFTVKRGDTGRVIAARLQAAGIVRSENLFVARYIGLSTLRRFETGRPLVLKDGTYKLPAGVSVDKVLEILNRGRSLPSLLTFPEGSTTHRIVQRMLADPRLEGEVTNMPAEGVLLPDTFDVRGMNRQALLARMNAAQQDLVSRLWAERSPNLPLQSPHEAIILASIVQREMGPNDDPRRIASVFVNRLRKGMRLESDPTILYGIQGREVDWSKPIYRSQIRKPTPFNTYTIAGLPPTPICNPGRAALEAVMRPAQTEDLYFVANGRGGHFFGKTLAEHNANVVKWRAIERELRKRRRERQAAEAAARRTSAADTRSATSATAASASVERVRQKVVPTIPIAGRSNGTAAAAPGSIPLPERKPNR
ncbi:MAG: endolytic transglycosylase MltG [Pseudomonadota bacterium]